VQAYHEYESIIKPGVPLETTYQKKIIVCLCVSFLLTFRDIYVYRDIIWISVRGGKPLLRARKSAQFKAVLGESPFNKPFYAAWLLANVWFYQRCFKDITVYKRKEIIT